MDLIGNNIQKTKTPGVDDLIPGVFHFVIWRRFFVLLCQREPETDSVIGIGSRIGFA